MLESTPSGVDHHRRPPVAASTATLDITHLRSVTPMVLVTGGGGRGRRRGDPPRWPPLRHFLRFDMQTRRRSRRSRASAGSTGCRVRNAGDGRRGVDIVAFGGDVPDPVYERRSAIATGRDIACARGRPRETC